MSIHRLETARSSPRATALAALVLLLSVLTAHAAAEAATPTCQGHTATHVGTTEADTITGTTGADVIVGLGGNDTLKGLGGDDIICGGAGKDLLVGGGGSDTLLGGRGGDTLKGGGSSDTLRGGKGSDDLRGNSWGDSLDGGRGTDTVTGGGGSDECVASEYTSGCETRPGCHASYPGVCIPPPPPDLNCGDLPYRDFVVIGSDPHGFDGNKDGIACEG